MTISIDGNLLLQLCASVFCLTLFTSAVGVGVLWMQYARETKRYEYFMYVLVCGGFAIGALLLFLYVWQLVNFNLR